jgi:hypothetical protein
MSAPDRIAHIADVLPHSGFAPVSDINMWPKATPFRRSPPSRTIDARAKKIFVTTTAVPTCRVRRAQPAVSSADFHLAALAALLTRTPLLILFTDSLGVGFAVRIEEVLAALLPRCLEFGRCDVPVWPAFLGNGT